MAITFDTSVDGGLGNSGTSLSWSHTCTGANLILWICVFGDQVTGDPTGNKITGVTYASAPMTELARVGITGDRWVYLFFLVGPSTGSNTILVSASSTIAIGGCSASYTGASQSGVPDASNTNSTNVSGPVSTGITTNLTTVADNCWTILAEKNDIGAAVADTGSTLRQSSANGEGIFDSNGVIYPAGSTSMKVNSGRITARWGIIMASFAPVGAAGPTLTLQWQGVDLV